MAKRIYILLLILLSFTGSTAQVFMWLKDYSGGKPRSVLNRNVTYSPEILADASGAFVLSYQEDSILVYDSITLHLSNYTPVILRINDTGKVLNAVPLATGGSVQGTFCIDDSSNVYVHGAMDSAGTITVGNQVLNSQNGSRFIVKYTKNLVPVWVIQFGAQGFQPVTLNLKKIYFKDGRLFFLEEAYGTFYIGNYTHILSSTSNTISDILTEINPLSGQVIWSSIIHLNSSNTGYCSVQEIHLLNNDIYMTASTTPSMSFVNPGAVFGTDTVYGQLCVLQFSSTGIYKHNFHVPDSKNSIMGSSISSVGNRIFLSGYFSDSLIIGKDTLRAEVRPNRLEIFFACLNKDLVPVWAFDPEEVASSLVMLPGIIPSAYTFSSFSSDGYIYFAGIMHGLINFQGSITGPNAGMNAGVFMAKMDSLGNFLWVTSGEPGSSATSFHGYPGQGVYACGNYQDDLSLGSFKLSLRGRRSFVTRISDYSITRGDVFAGPYCAGDSIKIPYINSGSFSTSNYFIAEMSDEKGEFNGKHREIGRLKSSVPDTIYGFLPSLYVASSANYRIRVRSTNPQVVSFFREDSLRLLIYSRDSADAGVDETICYGDTIQISTFGGTRWNWSPAVAINDTSLRDPLVWPATKTTYRIIISDSSGCGVTDTAYKTIFVNSPLSITAAFADTSDCTINPMLINAIFSGGDSNNYTVSWYRKNTLGTTLVKSGKISAHYDSLHIFDAAYDVPGTVYFAEIYDQCSQVSDTAFVLNYLSNYPRLKAEFLPKDSLLCNHAVLQVKALASGGKENTFRARWLDTSNVLLDTGLQYSLKAVHSGTHSLPEQYQVKMALSEKCLSREDTFFFSWKVLAPLKAGIFNDTNLVNDTALCYGQQITLLASGLGGKETNYSYQWKLNGENYSGTGSLLFDAKQYYDSLLNSSAGQAFIRLVLTDNCTSVPDSAELKITLHDPLKVSVPLADTMCYGSNQYFTGNFSGGRKENYSFLWMLNGVTVSTDSSFFFESDTFLAHNGQSGLQELKVVLSDNCTSPFSADSTLFLIRERLQVDISPDKACANPGIILLAKTSGGLVKDHTVNWFDEDKRFLGAGFNLSFQTIKPFPVYAVLDDMCSKPGSDSVIIYPQPRINVTLTDSAGCEPFLLEIIPTEITQTNNLYTLSESNHPVDSFRGTIYNRLLDKGKYSYSLEVTGEGNCRNRYTLPPVEVFPMPIAEFTWNPLQPDWDDKGIQFNNLSRGGSFYGWDIEKHGYFSDFEPFVSFEDSGAYLITLKTISDKGCEDTSSQILVVKPAFAFYIPNAFTPNGDGQNQQFVISGTGFKSYKIHIYNRWGQTIFTGNQDLHWDGTFMGRPVTDGAYIYIIDVVDNENNLKSYNGMVTVLR